MGVFVSLYDVCTSIYIEMKKYTRAHKGARLKYGAINKIKSFRKCPLAGRKTREIRVEYVFLFEKDIYFLIFPYSCREHKVLGLLKHQLLYSVL